MGRQKPLSEIEQILNSNTQPLPVIPVSPRAAPAKPEQVDIGNPFVSPFAAVDAARMGERKASVEPRAASTALEEDRMDCWKKQCPKAVVDPSDERKSRFERKHQ
jgi:hypothetical protein